jgi:CRP/FNR family cyclic AMP-dependent transcriptional regulator
MKDRFEDSAALKQALLGQRIILGNNSLVEALVTEGELVEYQPGQTVITQGASDRDVFFLLSGTVRIIINGVRHHTRTVGETLGEMSALNATIGLSLDLCG